MSSSPPTSPTSITPLFRDVKDPVTAKEASGTLIVGQPGKQGIGSYEKDELGDWGPIRKANSSGGVIHSNKEGLDNKGGTMTRIEYKRSFSESPGEVGTHRDIEEHFYIRGETSSVESTQKGGKRRLTSSQSYHLETPLSFL